MQGKRKQQKNLLILTAKRIEDINWKRTRRRRKEAHAAESRLFNMSIDADLSDFSPIPRHTRKTKQKMNHETDRNPSLYLVDY
jgi:acyl-CoA hydrolase